MGPSKQPTKRGRRQFLRKYFRWTLAITAAALFYPLLRFSLFTVKPQPRYITVNKKLASGSVYTDRDFILFILDDGPFAVSRTCTHLGCRVHYRQELELIECPCHQSRFTVRGTRIAGPAKLDLPTFPVKELEDDKGEVTGYIVSL